MKLGMASENGDLIMIVTKRLKFLATKPVCANREQEGESHYTLRLNKPEIIIVTWTKNNNPSAVSILHK